MSHSNSESVRPEPAQAPAEYAFWQSPEGRQRIEYSLPVFHELDFEVNEGYRRIPHGGIEVGGFLWGRVRPEGLRIEAFRQIPCEHASGPSFVLSQRDLVEAEKLLTGAHAEDALEGLQPVGWFVAHTRGPLVVTDREIELFRRWFPEPGRVMLLVKPERFQPTRFAFAIRQANGGIERDAAPGAFILPLPGRAGKGVVGSIPAPKAKPAAPAVRPTAETVVPKIPPGEPQEAELHEPEMPKPVQIPREAERPAAPVIPAAVALSPKPATMEPAAPAKPPATPQPPKPKVEPQPAAPVPVAAAVAPPPAPTPPLPKPAGPSAPKRQEQFRGVPDVPAPTPIPLQEPSRSGSVFRLFLLLLLAAALGCGVGYFAYLQLPSAYIPLHAERRGESLVVRWPADATRNLDHVAIRVDDGPPQPLTAAQKEAGEYDLQPPTNNTKLELIAQHWLRDSRGIIRYVNLGSAAANPAPASVPADRSPAARER
jgi:hypothetical protein